MKAKGIKIFKPLLLQVILVTFSRSVAKYIPVITLFVMLVNLLFPHLFPALGKEISFIPSYYDAKYRIIREGLRTGLLKGTVAKNANGYYVAPLLLYTFVDSEGSCTCESTDTMRLFQLYNEYSIKAKLPRFIQKLSYEDSTWDANQLLWFYDFLHGIVFVEFKPQEFDLFLFLFPDIASWSALLSATIVFWKGLSIFRKQNRKKILHPVPYTAIYIRA